MEPEQFAKFLESNERATANAIEKFVNGKIRNIDEKLSQHIARVEPVIKAYEDDQVISGKVTKVGEKVVFWGKIVTAIGVLVVGIKYGITKLW